MKDYSAMSDFEINKSVANLLSVKPKKTICFISYQESEDIWPDYCNNPADAWPIITANHIGIMPFKSGEAKAWPLSVGLLSGSDVKDANPLRAAMIVYLQMMEQKK